MSETAAIYVTVAVLCGVIGGAVGASKGQGGAGFFLGLLLGPLGVIVAAVLTPSPEIVAQRHRAMQAVLAPQSPPGWWPDPHRRAELRYFDGWQWTNHVSNGGMPSTEA